jgi:Peptidase M16 inactive domain
MWSTAYLWHNYGKSTIGSRADIEKVPASTLKRFYKKYYRPDNAVLLVTGKFEPNEALKLISDSFGGLVNPAGPIEPTYTTEPVQDGERTVTLRRNGDTQVVGIAYHVPGRSRRRFSGRRGVRSDPHRRTIRPALRRARQVGTRGVGELELVAAARSGRHRADRDRAGRQVGYGRTRQDDRDRRGFREDEDPRRGARALQGEAEEAVQVTNREQRAARTLAIGVHRRR